MTPEEWRRVKAIAIEALEQSEADRSAFVAARCDLDASLCREVESLLVSTANAAHLYEPPAFASEAVLTILEDVETPGSLVGRRIGAYLVVAELGRGGISFIGLGTDTNSLVKTPRPTMFDVLPGDQPRFTDIYNPDPNHPINAGVSLLSRSTTGTRTWDYNFHGVAHYGMYVDFLRDVRTWGGTATNTGKQFVDDQVMYGAENFYRMWLKAETQKTRVP